MPIIANKLYRRKSWLYALIDPRDGAMRYFGKCRRPKTRFRQHCRFGGRTPLGAWLTELRDTGLEPIMKVLGVSVAFSGNGVHDAIILDTAEKSLIRYASRHGEWSDCNLNTEGTPRENPLKKLVAAKRWGKTIQEKDPENAGRAIGRRT